MVGTGRADARTTRRVSARVLPTALTAILLSGLLLGCSADPTSSTGTDQPTTPPAATEKVPPEPAPLAPRDEAATTEPVPEDGSALRVGSLVDDFPVDLLPVPEDAVLLVTSAVPVGGSAVQEVSLNLRTRLSVAAVLRLYRGVLTDAGFSEVTPPTDETGPTADATFTRSGGDEVVTIGVVDVDGARTLTLGGRVRTGEGS